MSDFDDVVSQRAQQTLFQGAAAAVGLGLFQFCCNPFFIVTILAGAAAMNAIRQPRWMKISLDEDYPASAGQISTVAGIIGLVLVGLRVLTFFLGLGLLVSGNL